MPGRAHGRARNARPLLETDSARTRGEVRALTQALSAHLLAASSATNALHAWCEARGLAEGSIVARLHFQDQAPTLDEDTRKRLHVGTDEPVHRRRVELMRGELVLSEADNWFLPGRLAPSMRELLATTTIPFGKIVERLRPMRRTFLAYSPISPHQAMQLRFAAGG